LTKWYLREKILKKTSKFEETKSIIRMKTKEDFNEPKREKYQILVKQRFVTKNI